MDAFWKGIHPEANNPTLRDISADFKDYIVTRYPAPNDLWRIKLPPGRLLEALVAQIILHFQQQKGFPTEPSDKTLILGTGGTFSCKNVTTKGESLLSTEPGYIRPHVEDCLSSFCSQPDKFFFLELPEPIDSTNASIETWNEIALLCYSLVASEMAPFSSCVVLHGTDTLAESAAALSFMLWNVTKPIIITGSQLPLAPCGALDLGSDAIDNLLFACSVARTQYPYCHRYRDASGGKFETPETLGCLPGVWVAFHKKLMLGARVVKDHSQKLDAFDSPNRYPYVRELWGEEKTYPESDAFAPERLVKFDQDFCCSRRRPQRQAVLRLKLGQTIRRLNRRMDAPLQSGEARRPEVWFCNPKIQVEVLHIVPGSFRAYQDWYRTFQDGTSELAWALEFIQGRFENVHGFVVAAYGAGNLPGYISHMVAQLTAVGKKVAIITRCRRGTLDSHYATQARGDLLNDISVSAAYVKMVCLLSRNLMPAVFGKELVEPLREELSREQTDEGKRIMAENRRAVPYPLGDAHLDRYLGRIQQAHPPATFLESQMSYLSETGRVHLRALFPQEGDVNPLTLSPPASPQRFETDGIDPEEAADIRQAEQNSLATAVVELRQNMLDEADANTRK